MAAEDSFKIGDREFNAGSFLIKSDGNPSDLGARLAREVADLGLTAFAVEKMPEIASHALAVPRIALVHTWTNTQDEGWFRIEFERLGIPFSYISVHTLRDTSDLREKFDVIVFSPSRGSAQALVRGVAKRGADDPPIPWKKSDLTPNMGLSPDQTDDVRGGIEIVGVANIQKFIQGGGLLVTVGSNSSLPIDFGITDGVTITEPRTLQARGSVLNASFADRKSPIAYGYADKLAVYFNQSPIFNAGGLGGGFGGGGGGGGRGGAGGAGGPGGAGAPTDRPTGRGSLTDPDVPQGRPIPPPRQATPPRPGEEGIPEDLRDQAASLLPPPESRPRIVLRFAAERDLLVSGMLAGGSELANRPTVVDIPVGKGHVVMFANNPMWRHQTFGSYFLLFNAALNFDNLNAGRTAPRRGTAPNAGQDQ